MTDIPARRLLDRYLSLEITKDVRGVAGPALREVIDECVRAFERCSSSARGTDENIGLLFPFLHLAELLDATEIALASGIDPIKWTREC